MYSPKTVYPKTKLHSIPEIISLTHLMEKFRNEFEILNVSQILFSKLETWFERHWTDYIIIK